MPQRQAGDVGQVHAARQAEVVPAGDLRGDARRHQGSGTNEPCPFKTSPDIWLLDGSGDLVNLQFFPRT